MSIVEARKRLEKEWTVDERGLITNPGHLEREPLYVAWMVEMLGESAYDDLVYEGDTELNAFFVDEEIREAFPELNDVEVVVVYSDSAYFYHHTTMSRQDYEARKERIENEDSSLAL